MEKIIRSSDSFVVVDIETSHFHPEKGGRIIEIGAVKIINDKVVEEFSELINPERKISAKITEITGISNDMLIGKPIYQQVLPKFYDFCKDSVMIAHNSQFDWNRFLVFYFKKVGIYPKNHVVDTVKLARKYLPKNKGGYNLNAVCQALNVVNEDSHRALSDAKATGEVFLHIKNNLIPPAVEGDQLSLLGNAAKIEHPKPERQNVRKVSYWKKELKDKTMKRVYVTLDKATVYFDITSSSWGVKSSNGPVDFKQVQVDVLSHLNISDMNNVEDCFN